MDDVEEVLYVKMDKSTICVDMTHPPIMFSVYGFINVAT